MRLIALFVFFLNASYSGYAKKLPTDSLIAQLATASDTAKLRLYEQLYQATIHTQPEKAKTYTERWLRLARQLNQPAQEMSAMHSLGRYHYVQGNFSQAIHWSEQALTIAQAQEDTTQIASLYNGIGYMIFNQGQYDEALKYLYRGLRLNEVLHDSLAIHKSRFNIANVYVQNGNPRQALDHYLACANYFGRRAMESLVVKCWLNLGATYPNIGQYDSSYYYYQRALEHYQAQNDDYHTAKVLDGLGQNKMAQQQYTDAIIYYQQALQRNQAVQNQQGIALNFRDLGRAYSQLGQFVSALHYLHQAEEISQQAEAPQELMNDYEALAETYAAQGDYSRAYRYRQQFFDLYQQVYNQEKEQQMAELEAKYQLDKKEQAIALQNQKIALLAQQNIVERYQRWSLIGGFVLVAILAGVWYSRQRLKEQKARVLQEKDRLITQEKLRNSKLAQQQLQQKLAFKNRELTTHALHLGQKTELLEEIKNRIDDLSSSVSDHDRAALKQLKQVIRGDQFVEGDWDSFIQHFEQVHPHFSHKLKEAAKELTPNEIRLAMMLKMNLSTKEIASITNISPEGVKKARYRLRKKLNLPTEENIQKFILRM